MKKIIFAACALIVASASFAQGVGVSVSVGEPGFYGQIDIGHVAPPALIYSTPVLVARPAYGYVEQPLYLRVPPEHVRYWSRYCDAYHACGRHVYFVQDHWYNNVYAPQYRIHAHEWYGQHDRYEDHARYERYEDHHERRYEDRHDDRRDWRNEYRGNEHGEYQYR
ncbi:hypothetical protein ACO0KY_10610 [Undibacterium sp. Dicai25W]|uniref:hypothetical protein n=1 Tax=Undibacterium sp. Dicai25W TaxID=3413034 RepID=UPI003BF229CA